MKDKKAVGWRVSETVGIEIRLVGAEKFPSDAPCVEVGGQWVEQPGNIGLGFRTILGLLPLRLVKHIDLLSALQEVHDTYLDWANTFGLAQLLRFVAGEFNLNTGVLIKYEAQAIYDKVIVHLFEQGVQALLPNNNRCAYRGANGTKCAVGILIDDCDYNEGMETEPVCVLIERYAELTHLEPHLKLLTELQLAHDNIKNWNTTSTMKLCLAGIANNHNLSSDILSTLSFKDR